MARAIIGVIAGYVVMFILNFLGFVTLYAVIGSDQAFKPGLFLASNKWIAISFVIIFITGTIAGLVCAAIAKGGKAPFALAIVVIVLGLLLAILAMMKAQANAKFVRGANVPQMEAAQKAYWPTWTPFTFPVISAIGVLVGGRLKRRV